MASHADRLYLFHLVLVLVCALGLGDSPLETVHRRFEYKYSFKGPHLVQKDNTIPFWDYGGSAMASPEQIRVTPSLRSKRGFVWTKTATNFENWEVEMACRVTGRGRIGADGLAMWYTATPGLEGDVFGSADQWNGVGVFFDSFDNDGLQNNPYIMVVVNDGTKNFNHHSDGRDQQVAGCLKDFRNKPFPVKAKLEYYKNVLTLSISNGLSNDDNYEICVRAENIFLPKFGHFGISAATGGLADDHDVLSFSTHSLTDPLEQQSKVAEEEREKYEKEYREYEEKLDKERKRYREQNPDQRFDEDDPNNWFEATQARELRQIFDGQTDIQHTVRLLNKKIDELQVRQETSMNQVIAVANRASPGGSTGGGVMNPEQIQNLLEMGRSLNDITRVLNDLKNEVRQKQGLDGIQDLKNYIKSSLAEINQEPCPVQKSSECATFKSLIILVVLQAIVVVGYLIYKSNKDAQAKKFY